MKVSVYSTYDYSVTDKIHPGILYVHKPSGSIVLAYTEEDAVCLYSTSRKTPFRWFFLEKSAYVEFKGEITLSNSERAPQGTDNNYTDSKCDSHYD